MQDMIVSVRMPLGLVQELKSLQTKNHFLDLSEQLRSIIRNNCVQITQPSQQNIKREMMTDLKNMIQEIKDNKTETKLRT